MIRTGTSVFIPALVVSLNSSHSGRDDKHQTPLNSSENLRPYQSKNSSQEFYVIKVAYETNSDETEGIVLYKSIKVRDNNLTPHVIRIAMYKLGLTGNPDNYILAQVFPDKDMVLPLNANVYHAVNMENNLNFILRQKKLDTNGKASMYKNKL